jgi:SAM-dependent methyltransferase
MSAIARFNWPFYVAATAVLLAALAGLIFFPLKLVFAFVAAGTAYFFFASLGVSHLIYDRSDLYRWSWLDRALRHVNLKRAIFCHCGFDETSAELRARLEKTEWLIIDHFDETKMTEGSIRRARRMFPPTAGTVSAAYDRWPVATESVDVVFGFLAIHELRSHRDRSAWFCEARRCLRQGGRIVLVEHLRDYANFFAFGPGFLHFHSLSTWRRAWESAGFRSADEFRITPWVRVFVLALR